MIDLRLVLATQNQGKVKELKRILQDLPVEVLSLDAFPNLPEVEETGDTFAENALIKAREVAAHTGLLAMADDSGLEVDHLQGAPGVYSARFAGEPKSDSRNNEKLLRELAGLPLQKRTARFKCAIALCQPKGEEHVVSGACEGLILEEIRGQGGFGYDPLFYVPEYDQTFAELDLTVKNQISHRGKAMQEAIQVLKSIIQE